MKYGSQQIFFANNCKYRYVLALGSNREALYSHTIALVRLYSLLTKIKQSKWIKTLPLRSKKIDTSQQQPYFNLVVEGASSLSPTSLYHKLRQIEDELGHNRCYPWQSRAMDIDILLVADNITHNFSKCPLVYYNDCYNLSVPHPRLYERSFLIKLICEIIPEYSVSKIKNICAQISINSI